MWLRLDKETANKLLALCEEHAPELGETLLEELARYEGDPEQPWQDQETAVKLARDRWMKIAVDDIEVDDDAALSTTDNGLWVQGWLWVDKSDLEYALTEGVHES
jgi:hypothetical protein